LYAGLHAENKAKLWPDCIPIYLAVILTLTLLTGCGGQQKPTVGPIQFTDFNGAQVPAVTTLSVNGQIYLVATVTNDSDLLGVSWTVTCGSATLGGPGGTVISTACGVCQPAQTMSGPVPTYPSTGIITTYTAPSMVPKGGTVTITAHATTLPSVSSSVTLTIVSTQSASSAVAPPGAALTANLNHRRS
jgi:hypothetical protein